MNSIILSSGLREIVKFLVQNKLVDAVVSTAGGIEEDLMKCVDPFKLGDFEMPGYDLRGKGWNRNGNIIIETYTYLRTSNLLMPILDEMLEEQKSKGTVWSPSTLIAKLSSGMGNETSVCYWAAKNNIPVYCPAIVDGGMGESLLMHTVGNPGLKLDVVQDHVNLSQVIKDSYKTAGLIIGGGVPKHMILNAQRGGLNHAVFINTAQEFDGSDSGARPDESVGWGEIHPEATPIKLFAEASLVFPLIVAKTFVPYLQKIKNGRILI